MCLAIGPKLLAAIVKRLRRSVIAALPNTSLEPVKWR
jgi:hypothetical protein